MSWSSHGVCELEAFIMLNPSAFPSPSFPRSHPRSLLCAALAGLAIAAPVAAQPRDMRVADASLPPVVVTATRGDSRVDALVADVTVLTRADLDQAQGHTLAELLGSQAGIQSSSNGGPGQSDAIYMRGLEGRHTLVLVDGMRMGSATTGEPSLANLPLSAIERIEIVRGPLASLYGSDAVAGVVQVFTRRAQPGAAANASIGVGRYGRTQATAGFSGAEGPWSLAIQAAHDRASGFSATNPRNTFSYNPDQDGFDQSSGSARLGLHLGGDWQVQTRAFSSESLNDYDDGPGQPASFRARNRVLGAEVGGTVLPGWKSKLGVASSNDSYDAVSVSSPFSERGEIATTQRQISLENTVATPLGSLLMLGEHLHQSVDKPGVTYTVRERRINALGLGLSGEAGAHLWQLSVRGDRNSQYGRQKTGSAAYGWRFLPGWTVGGQVGTAFVAPSFNDLYWPNDGFGQGNPNLRPTRSRSAEVSVGYKQDGVQAKLTAHRARVSDLIQWVETPPGSFFYVPSNVARAAVDGFTLQAQAPLAGLVWQGSIDQLDARDQDTGKELARRARRTARAGVDGRTGDWRYGASVAGYAGRWSDAANTNRLGGYAVLDLRADWQLGPEWALGARLNNALDRTYETATGYNQPGRALMVTLRYQGR